MNVDEEGLKRSESNGGENGLESNNAKNHDTKDTQETSMNNANSVGQPSQSVRTDNLNALNTEYTESDKITRNTDNSLNTNLENLEGNLNKENTANVLNSNAIKLPLVSVKITKLHSNKFVDHIEFDRNPVPSRRLISLQIVQSTRYILENLLKSEKNGIDIFVIFGNHTTKGERSKFVSSWIEKSSGIHNGTSLENNGDNSNQNRSKEDEYDENIAPGIYVYSSFISLTDTKRCAILLESCGIDENDIEVIDIVNMLCTLFASATLIFHPGNYIDLDVLAPFVKTCKQLQGLQPAISVNNPALVHILTNDKGRGMRYKDFLLNYPQLQRPTSIIESLIPFENQDIAYFYSNFASAERSLNELLQLFEYKTRNAVPKLRFSISKILTQMHEATICLERGRISAFNELLNNHWIDYIRTMKKKRYRQFLDTLNHDLKYSAPNIFKSNVNTIRKNSITTFYDDVKPLLGIPTLNENVRKNIKSLNKKMKHKAESLLSVWQSPPPPVAHTPVLRERKRKRFIDEDPVTVTREELLSPFGYRFEDRSYTWEDTFHDHNRFAIYTPNESQLKCDECDQLIDNFEVYSIGKRLCSISKKNGRRNGYITMEFPVEGDDYCHLNCYEPDVDIDDILYEEIVTDFPGFNECPSEIQDYYLRCSGKPITVDTPKWRRVPQTLENFSEGIEQLNDNHHHNEAYENLPDSSGIHTIYDDTHRRAPTYRRQQVEGEVWNLHPGTQGHRKKPRYDIDDIDLEPLEDLDHEFQADQYNNTGTIQSPHLSPITAMRTPRANYMGELWTPDLLSQQILKSHQPNSASLYRIHNRSNPQRQNPNNIQYSEANVQDINLHHEVENPNSLADQMNSKIQSKWQRTMTQFRNLQPTFQKNNPEMENYSQNLNRKGNDVQNMHTNLNRINNNLRTNEDMKQVHNLDDRAHIQDTVSNIHSQKSNENPNPNPSNPTTPPAASRKDEGTFTIPRVYNEFDAKTPQQNPTQMEKRMIRLQRFSLLEQSSLDDSWNDTTP